MDESIKRRFRQYENTFRSGRRKNIKVKTRAEKMARKNALKNPKKFTIKNVCTVVFGKKHVIKTIYYVNKCPKIT